MNLDSIKNLLPKQLYEVLKENKITKLRPSQKKAIEKGLFKGKNLLICTPTASGKTLIAEIASINSILKKRKKAVYIVPLKALAQEKYNEFKKRYSKFVKVALSISDIDSSDSYLADYDLIITVSEKMDSLIRHKSPWIKDLDVVIIDEIHLINSVDRGPTLEVLITLFKTLSNPQIIGLSATIGNPEEIAEWLEAELVVDNWRPVKLHQGIYIHEKNKIEFY